MPKRQLRTANYSAEARARLGDAVNKARLAAGYKWRTEFARAANIKSVRSIEMIEAGEPGVGQAVLYAVGRFLPYWDEDTPQVILEGGPIPPTVHELPPVRIPTADELDRMTGAEIQRVIARVEEINGPAAAAQFRADVIAYLDRRHAEQREREPRS